MKKLLADYIEEFKLIRRDVRLFLFGGLLMGIMAAFVQLLLNLYFKQAGLGEGFIGRVLSMIAFGSLAAAIPSAYLVSRYKIKTALLHSTILLCVFFVIISTSKWQWLVLAAGFCLGLMQSVKNVASAPIIMRETSERERTLVFSLNFSTWVVSGIIGSLLGGWLHDAMLSWTHNDIQSYQIALIIAAILGFAAIIPFSMMKSHAPNPGDAEKAFSFVSLKQKRGLFTKLMLPYFVLGAGAGLIIPFLNLYFRNRFSLEPSRIGVYFSILQVFTLIAVLIAPILKRKMGFIRTVVLTEILSIPFMTLLCFTNNLSLAFWAFLFRGALMNMGGPVSTSFMMEAVNKEDHGLINSLSSLAWTSSWAISAQVGGSMIERHGFIGVFLLAIGLYVASASLYFAFFYRSEHALVKKTVFERAKVPEIPFVD